MSNGQLDHGSYAAMHLNRLRVWLDVIHVDDRLAISVPHSTRRLFPHATKMEVKIGRNSISISQLAMRCGDAAKEFNGVQWSSMKFNGVSWLPALALPSKPKASVQPQKLKKCPVACRDQWDQCAFCNHRYHRNPQDLAAKCKNRWDQTAGALTWWLPMIYTAVHRSDTMTIRICRAKSEFRVCLILSCKIWLLMRSLWQC